ncbi:MAG: hypothetical protein ACHQU0_03490 [Candidatus Paceibacteria bacterium]
MNTMGEAICLGAPTAGRMSKRSRKAALKRLHDALFPEGFPVPVLTEVNDKDVLLRRAKELRDLASRGMRPRAHVKEASRLEEKAATL